MNYYLILGISEHADEDTIRQAFRVLARRYHPDAGSGSSVEKFRQIFEAFETLRDPARRAAYDYSLRARPLRTRSFTVEPLRAESRRAEAIRHDFFFRRNVMEQVFNQFIDELFGNMPDYPFTGPRFHGR
jgi:curved DNA-binding protein CbpA